MRYGADKRIVMTLDAGGTNFVFSAIQGNQEIVQPITLPSNGDNLELCLATIVKGFKEVGALLAQPPVAISFAFPGPADYPSGVIGDLGNLPGFRGGVALGPMLMEEFKLPVFINNDGDLFAYGESIAGLLPHINNLLEKAASPRRFHNLLGIALGTGFGGGIVHKGELFTGDNSAAGEVWLLRNKINPAINAEEGASIRAVRRTYAECAVISSEQAPTPKDIYEIGIGKQNGNRDAALTAFSRMAEVVGDAIANALTLIDGLVVIGGGVANAYSLFLPAVVKEMNTPFIFPDGQERPRLVSRVYNLEELTELDLFIRGEKKVVTVPGRNAKIAYDPLRRVGVGMSRLGTSKAVSIGAYAFALNALDGDSARQCK